MTKFTEEQLQRDQINSFFSSYSSDWRFIKILSNQKLWQIKYDFYSSIDKQYIEINENTIADEISNGLLFDTLQHSIQYIEDLFALINAGTNNKYFIRSIVMYNAGKVQNSIKEFDISHKNLCKSFHFPDYQIQKNDNDKILNKIYESLEVLKKLVAEIIDFYETNLFFYNQYKHGLSIALKSIYKPDNDAIEKDKTGNLERNPLIALECINFEGAIKKKNGNLGALVIPLSDAIQQSIEKLQKDNNLMRYVFSPENSTIDRFVDIAEKTRLCMIIYINNIIESISDKDILTLQLPTTTLKERIAFDIEIKK